MHTAGDSRETVPSVGPLTADDVQGKLRYIVEKSTVVVGNLPRRFLEAFEAILTHANYRNVVDTYSRLSSRCANCASACQIYQHTRAPEDVPCYRSHLLLDVYRRHFTLRGRIESRVMGRPAVTEADILEMASTYYDCTACRRCSLECPLGLDHGLITHLARYVLSEVGLVPRALVVSTRAQLEGPTRNTSAIPFPAISDSLEFLADEIKEGRGHTVNFPVDQEGREYAFFAPVSDFIMEADTLMGIGLALSAGGSGDDWTIGSKFFDGINYGLFYNDWVLERIITELVEETRRLKARKILIGECGHAARTARAFASTFCGPDAPEVVHIITHTHRAFKDGRLTLTPGAITERVTYHDPCNIGRNKWLLDEPRELLAACCSEFVEMTPNREHNLCCGGGGGTVSVDELRPYRTGVCGAKKAEQLAATGAKYVVAPCANCKKQLRELVEDHKLDMQVVGLHDLLYRAIALD